MPNARPVPVGARFGRLVVLENRIVVSGRKGYYARATCDCGVAVMVLESSLWYENTRSCGCLKRDYAKSGVANKRHGHAPKNGHSPTLTSWASMIGRVTNPNSIGWNRYGGRGIKVCERWKTFENFLADMGERPAGTSIDRIDNNGDYEPGNCRWGTRQEQAENTSSAIMVTLNGEQMSMSRAARVLGIDPSSLHDWQKRYGIGHQEAVDHYMRTRAERAAGVVRKPKPRIDAHWLSLDGERMILARACERLGIARQSIFKRVKRLGETPQQALDHFVAKRGGAPSTI